MYKTAATELLKTARRVGVTRSLLERGYSPEAIKLAYVQEGLADVHADALVKEAIGWLRPTARLISTGISKLAPTIGEWGKEAPGLVGRIQRGLGGIGQQGAESIQKALHGYSRDPAGALWSGAKNFGKGLFFGGEGLGGAAGKAVSGYSMLSPMLGGNQ